nr:hypothetical protein [Tanacetum cinerariifolium]
SGLQDYKFLIQVLTMKIKKHRREETPRIVGDDSARSEPTEVADSNDFKPLLKEKRLKEQTWYTKRHGGIKLRWNDEGKGRNNRRCYCVLAVNATQERKIHIVWLGNE